MLVLDLFIANAPAEVRREHMERARNGSSDLDHDLAKLRSLLGHRYDRIRDNLPELLERYGDLRDPRAVKGLLARLRDTRVRGGARPGAATTVDPDESSRDEWELEVAGADGRTDAHLN
jgi:hypothetical protein